MSWYRPPSEPNSCFDSLHENLSCLDGEGKEIKEPIRVMLDSSTLIDHIATTNCNNITESGVFKISLVTIILYIVKESCEVC